jgi:hypothetical protein
MEHPINKPIDAAENEPSLSVTALVVVLSVVFASYFTVQGAVADLPIDLHRALVDMPRS